MEKIWKGIASNRVDDQNQFEGTGTIDNSKFDVGSVNLEENALGTPPYVLPPGIEKTSSQRKCRCSKTKQKLLFI